MADIGNLGKTLFIAGILMAAIGGFLLLIRHVPGLPFGRLPGDISVNRDGFSFYFPLTTMIVISLVVSIILWLIGVLRK